MTKSFRMKLVLSFLFTLIVISSGCGKTAVAPTQSSLYPSIAEKQARLDFEEAKSNFEAKRYDLARTFFEGIVEGDFYNELTDPSLYYLGEISSIRGRSEDALRYYDKAVSRVYNPKISPEAYFKAALILFEMKKYTDAVDHLLSIKRGDAKTELLIQADSLGMLSATKANFSTFIWALNLMDDYKMLSTPPQCLRAESQDADLAIDQESWGCIFEIIAEDGAKMVADEWLRYNNLNSDQLAGYYDEQRRGLHSGGYLSYALARSYYYEGKRDEALKELKNFKQSYGKHDLYDQAMLLYNEVSDQVGEGGVKIGVLLPLSGKYKVYGDSVLKGIECAAGIYEPCKGSGNVKLFIRDTAGNPGVAAEAMRSLNDAGVVAVIGPLMSINEEAVAALTKEFKLPMISFTQKGEASANEYLFRNRVRTEDEVETIVKYASEVKGLKRFYVLHPLSAKGTEYFKLFAKSVMEYGGKIVGDYEYSPNQLGFMEEIKRHFLLAGGKNSDVYFQAVFIPDSYWTVGRLASAISLAGIEGVQFLGNSRWNNDRLVQDAGEFINNAVFTDAFVKNGKDLLSRHFTDDFKSVYDLEPTLLEALGFDSARMIISSSQSGSDPGRDYVKKHLSNISNFQGVTGSLSVDEKRNVQRKLKLLIVRNGKIEEL
ncbi:MAG: penicillin-binding protein activator [Pseudomonadota bacterium]